MKRILPMAAAFLVGAIGVAMLHFCEGTDAQHHSDWAVEHGFPEPSWGMWLGGVIATLIGAARFGFLFAQPKQT